MTTVLAWLRLNAVTGRSSVVIRHGSIQLIRENHEWNQPPQGFWSSTGRQLRCLSVGDHQDEHQHKHAQNCRLSS
jgi:hypothetical protein